MNISEKYQQVKTHIQENKATYLVGVGCLGSGYLLRGLFSPDVIQTFNGTDNIGTVVNRSKNVKVIIKYLNHRGYVAKPIRCLDTLEEWPSQAEAAAKMLISATNLSQHLNGKQSNVSGYHFEWI